MRQPGEGRGACVDRNANETTGGQHGKVLAAGLAGAAAASALRTMGPGSACSHLFSGPFVDACAEVTWLAFCGNSSGGQQSTSTISPTAQARVNHANQQIQNQLRTFSGYAGTKLLGRALIGGGLGAVRGFYKAAQTDSPWIIASSAVVGAAIGVGWNILSDINTIRNIQNSFMNKFVACTQNASVPKPPE